MKTINDDIDIFETYKSAKWKFNREEEADLLEANVGKEIIYFVDRSKKAIKEWPNKYKLLETK